jgi:hypothetical protein
LRRKNPAGRAPAGTSAAEPPATETLPAYLSAPFQTAEIPIAMKEDNPNQENPHYAMFKGLHPLDLGDIQVFNHRDAFGLHLIKSLC